MPLHWPPRNPIEEGQLTIEFLKDLIDVYRRQYGPDVNAVMMVPGPELGDEDNPWEITGLRWNEGAKRLEFIG